MTSDTTKMYRKAISIRPKVSVLMPFFTAASALMVTAATALESKQAKKVFTGLVCFAPTELK